MNAATFQPEPPVLAESYLERIDWVDTYVQRITPFIHVREYDSLLIKIPNRAFKLNPSGIRLLRRLQAGERARQIAAQYPRPEVVARDIHFFFCDLLAALKGSWRPGQPRRAVEEVPFAFGFQRLPVLSEMALTYRCNLACVFCYASCGCHKKPVEQEMDTAEVKRVLDLIRHEAEVPSVSFTGGEPTLRPDLSELVAHAKALGLWTNLISNGTLLNRNLAQRLREAGLNSAQISLEGGSAALHDAIVQQPGAFERARDGIQHLREAGIRVHTNTTISRQNRAHLKDIVQLVHQLGLVRFSMNMLMPAGAAAVHLDQTFIAYREIGPLVMEVSALAQKLNLEFMWYSPTPLCLFNPITNGLGNKGCAACDGLLSVSPAGDILPCSSYAQPMGKLLTWEGHFKELWQSAPFAWWQQKRFAHPHCQECDDFAACHGACPLYWQKAGYDEIQSSPMNFESTRVGTRSCVSLVSRKNGDAQERGPTGVHGPNAP